MKRTLSHLTLKTYFYKVLSKLLKTANGKCFKMAKKVSAYWRYTCPKLSKQYTKKDGKALPRPTEMGGRQVLYFFKTQAKESMEDTAHSLRGPMGNPRVPGRNIALPGPTL